MAIFQELIRSVLDVLDDAAGGSASQSRIENRADQLLEDGRYLCRVKVGSRLDSVIDDLLPGAVGPGADPVVGHDAVGMAGRVSRHRGRRGSNGGRDSEEASPSLPPSSAAAAVIATTLVTSSS